MLIILVVVLLTMLLFITHNKNYEVVYFKLYPSKIMEKYHVNQLRLKDGKYFRFDTLGNTIMTGEYRNGLKNGKWIVYRNKKIYKLYNFKDDLLDGQYLEYYPVLPNNLYIKGFYKNDKMHGLWMYFDSKGNIEMIETLVNDSLIHKDYK